MVDETDIPKESSERVLSNLKYFKRLMAMPDFDPQMFWDGMNRLMMINAENFRFNEVKEFRSSTGNTHKNKVHADMISKMPHRFSQGGF